jgi:hypothetical protein
VPFFIIRDKYLEGVILQDLSILDLFVVVNLVRLHHRAIIIVDAMGTDPRFIDFTLDAI